jgi:CheY-like chemotaxis protein
MEPFKHRNLDRTGHVRHAMDTILIVEPDILARFPLAEFLRECGYAVLEASDQQEARMLLEGSGRQVDVVLVDVSDNHGQGFEFAKWAGQFREGLQVIRAGTVSREVEAARRLCAEKDVTKPYDHDSVRNLIASLLAARERSEA